MFEGSYNFKSSKMTKQEEVSVAIIGAGPTGLTCAIGLLQSGISCAIFDQRDTTTTESRGMVVHAMTLEVLRAFGSDIVEQLIARGRKIEQSNTINRRKLVATAKLRTRDDTIYDYALIIPQSDTEEILSKEVKRLNGVIRWNTKVETIEEKSDHVEVTYIDTTNLSTKTLKATYLIGCDGAHSTTRHQLGISFVGSPYPINLWACDVPIDKIYLPSIESQSFGFISRKTGALVIPLPCKNLFRIIIGENVPSTSDSEQIQDQPLSFFKEILHTHCPASKNWEFHEPVWNNHFHIHCRLANQYRSNGGHCFLAGDSAHLYSPFGGQGMNIGIQDAVNLSWKLSYVIKEKSPSALLETYETERLFTSKRALLLADWMTKIVGAQFCIIIWLRNYILFPIVKNIMFIQKRTVAQFQGLTFYCTPNPAAVECITGGNQYWQRFRSLVRGGARLPNISVSFGCLGSVVRLHDLFKTGDSQLVFFLADIKSPAVLLSHVKLAEAISISYTGCFDVVLIVSIEKVDVQCLFESPECPIEILCDPKNALQKSFRLFNPACVFIRPDNYVGYCSVPIDAFSLLQFLQTNFLAVDAERIEYISANIESHETKWRHKCWDVVMVSVVVTTIGLLGFALWKIIFSPFIF